MGRIVIQEGDITATDAEAIVNAANTDLVLGGGVAGAIRQRGGPAIEEECRKIGPIPLGEAAITAGGNLRAKCVIHAASMSRDRPETTEELLRQAVQSALRRAEEKKLRSVAFPAIGTGAAGFPLRRCAEVMLEEVRRHLASGSALEEIRFVLFGEQAYRVFEEVNDSAKIAELLGKDR